MKQFVIQIIILVLIVSCTRLTPKEKELRNNLNKILELNMFKTVQQRDTLMSFDRFRQRFKYISVVYLEDGCKPCYTKFIEWQNKMDSIITRKDYTVLFVIQGFTFNEFMAKVLDIDSINDHYYTIMDSNYTYLHNNKSIPKWIIDSSILIDQNNKIKIVGAPWSTKEMSA